MKSSRNDNKAAVSFIIVGVCKSQLRVLIKKQEQEIFAINFEYSLTVIVA